MIIVAQVLIGFKFGETKDFPVLMCYDRGSLMRSRVHMLCLSIDRLESTDQRFFQLLGIRDWQLTDFVVTEIHSRRIVDHLKLLHRLPKDQFLVL